MAKTIIGRIKEKEILSNALNSSRSELIAVYGRRRIGKTFLIREFHEKQMIFSMTGYSSGTRAVQIKNFMTKLNEVTDEFTIDAGYLKRLETKKREYKTDKAGRKGVYITMMTTYGLKSNKYSTTIVDHNLKMNCLFE